MIVIRPIEVTQADVLSHNIAIPPAWDSAVYYNQGDMVSTQGGGAVWEAQYGRIRADWTCFTVPDQYNYNQDPDLELRTSYDSCYPDSTHDRLWWLSVSLGMTPEMRMFQEQVDVVSENTGSINIHINPKKPFDSLIMLGLVAQSVAIKMYDPGGALIYDRTQQLAYPNPMFLDELPDNDKLLYLDIPKFDPASYAGYTNPPGPIEITATAKSPTDTVKIGLIGMGLQHYLGCTLEGTTVGIEDFSKKELDVFGRPVIIERSYADQATFVFEVEKRRVDEILRYLAAMRADPGVYIGDSKLESTWVYGFYQDLSFPINEGDSSTTTLDVIGLT